MAKQADKHNLPNPNILSPSRQSKKDKNKQQSIRINFNNRLINVYSFIDRDPLDAQNPKILITTLIQ